MAVTIDDPAKCELRRVIRFLQADGNRAAEIHRRMIIVHEEIFLSDADVRECCRRFKDRRTVVHGEGGQGQKTFLNKFPRLSAK